MAQSVAELYAVSLGLKCEGRERCYWCNAPCSQSLLHDQPTPLIGQRNFFARCPSSPYICIGCWSYQRKRVSLWHLDGRLIDIQAPNKNSLLITSIANFALDKEDAPHLYPWLLRPAHLFSLVLHDKAPVNHLQLAPLNDLFEIRGDTEIKFLLDNHTLSYTPYELEYACRHPGEKDGLSPGVQAIFRIFGSYELPPEKVPCAKTEKNKKGAGRHNGETANLNTPQRLLRAAILSGGAEVSVVPV